MDTENLQNRIQTLEQQMKEHYHNGVVGRRINVYDIDGLKKGTVTYAGGVGTSLTLPAGWSSSHPGTGQFVITHNLGTLNYSVTCEIMSPTDTRATGISRSTNSFQINIGNSNNSGGQDYDFNFIVIPF